MPTSTNIVDGKLLASHLADQPRGTIVSYEAIEQLLGYDLRNNRAVVSACRRALLNEHNLVLECVRGQGYRTLPDNELSGALQRARASRARNARLAIRQVETVDTSKLKPSEVAAIVCEHTIAHVTAAVSKGKSAAAIANKINGSADLLPLNHALDAVKQNLS